MQDHYGLSISSRGPAIEQWLQGLEAGFSFDSSGIAQHSKALELAPDFALAHAALARQLMIHGERDQALVSLDRACKLSAKVNDREASQIGVISANMHFRANALELALEHIEKWPLDITVLSMIVGPFGMLAFSGQANWRKDSLALLQKHQHRWPTHDWWYQSALAFAFAESAGSRDQAQLDLAQRVAEQAWALKEVGNCAHTLSHVYYALGDEARGKAFLKGWLAGHGQTSDMRHHLVWHDFLLEFDAGNLNKAEMTALYQTEFDPTVADPMPLTTFADNASFLWRCSLQGLPLDVQCALQMVNYAKQYFPSLEFSFAATHRVLVTALLGCDRETQALRTSISELKNMRVASFLEDLLTGAVAFTQGDYAGCVSRLNPLVSETILIGGSNPQRVIVQQTYERAKLNLEGGA